LRVHRLRRLMIREWGERQHYPVVVFDVDGTLLRGTTVSLRLANGSGMQRRLLSSSGRFMPVRYPTGRCGKSAGRLDKARLTHARSSQTALGSTAWRKPSRALIDADVDLLLGTVTWRFVAEMGNRRSDVPLFERVGMSIALNEARAAATSGLDTDNLRDVLTILPSVR
jgi:hypothetical protein